MAQGERDQGGAGEAVMRPGLVKGIYCAMLIYGIAGCIGLAVWLAFW